MADNNYVPGSPGAGLPRTNPQAQSPANVLKLTGMKRLGECDYNPTYTGAVTNGGNTLTFTPTAGHTDANLKVMRWTISDEDGMEVCVKVDLANRATPVAANTTNLDKLKKWRIVFYATLKNGCSTQWQLHFPGGYVGGNPTFSGQNV